MGTQFIGEMTKYVEYPSHRMLNLPTQITYFGSCQVILPPLQIRKVGRALGEGKGVADGVVEREQISPVFSIFLEKLIA